MQKLISRSRGLTLMELLTTISISGVVLAIGIPSFQTLILNNQMNALNNQLFTHLNQARIIAVSTAQRTVLCPSRDQSSCNADSEWQDGWIMFADANHSRERDDEEPVLYLAQAIENTFSLTSARSRRRISFFPDGTSPGSNTTFEICDQRGPERARAIVLSNTGRARQSRKGPGGRSIRCPEIRG